MKLLEGLRPHASFFNAIVRHACSLAWILALGFAAWVAADLFWRVAAPNQAAFPVVNESNPERAAQMIAARNFMGARADPMLPSDPGRFSLHGVVTGEEKHPGFAVLSVDGGTARGMVAGDEVVSGTVLERIFADHVELRLATGIRKVFLPRAMASDASVPPAQQAFTKPVPPMPPPSQEVSMPQPARPERAPGS